MAERTRKSRGGASKASQRKRESEVFETAVKIFNERGYASTSIQDIADALGILKGSVYYYIDSKEDLLFEIIDAVHEDVRRIFSEALSRDDLRPLDRLAEYIRNQTEYNARNVAQIAVYYRDLDRLSEGRLNDVKGRQARHFRSLVGLIGEIKAEGEISDEVDPALAARGVLSTMIWVYTWYRPGGAIKPEALAEFTVGFAIGGMSGYRPLPVPAEASANAA